MLDLDEQIRRYLDATAPALDVEPFTSVDGDMPVVLAERSPDRTRRVRTLAVAASMAILVAGIGAILITRDGSPPTIDSEHVDTAIPTTVESVEDVAPTSQVEPAVDPDVDSTVAVPTSTTAIADDGTGLALDWTQVVLPGDGPFTLLEYGGDSFYLADTDGNWFSSAGGVVWQPLGLDEAVVPPEVDPWSPHPVAAFGNTITLVEHSSPVVVINTDSGRVERRQRLSAADAQGEADLLGAGSVVAVGERGTLVVDSPLVEDSPEAWFSDDGIEWLDISSAGPFGRPARVRVAAIDGGFVALVAGETDGEVGSNFLNGANELWFSADGIAWELRDSSVELPFFPQALLTWQGGAVGVWPSDWNSPSPSTDGMIVVTADDVTTRSIDDMAHVEALADSSPAHVDTGELGIAFAYTLDIVNPGAGQIDGPVNLVEFSVDGQTWSRRTLPTEVDLPQRVAVGSTSIAVLGSTHGNPPWGAQTLWIGTPES